MIELDHLWNDEDWVDLPEDDIDAFARLVVPARRRYRDRIQAYDDPGQRAAISHAYVTHMLGVAKERDVAPFNGQNVPYLRNFTEDYIDDFDSDLNMFLARAKARASKRVSEAMVTLSVRESNSIRLRLTNLRSKLDETAMESWRKKRLMAKLDEFEAELTRGRVNLGNVALIAATLIALPGGVDATLKTFGIDFQKDFVAPIVEARCQAEKQEWVYQALQKSDPKLLSGPSRSLASFPSATPKRIK